MNRGHPDFSSKSSKKLGKQPPSNTNKGLWMFEDSYRECFIEDEVPYLSSEQSQAHPKNPQDKRCYLRLPSAKLIKHTIEYKTAQDHNIPISLVFPRKIIKLEEFNSFCVSNNQIFNFLKDPKTKSDCHTACSCSTSKCQARYCSCFSAGVACGETCRCHNCYNIESRPEIFLQVKPQTGCKCMRTRCIKLYCECKKMGEFCCADCRCFECLNVPAIENIDISPIKALRQIVTQSD